MENETTRSQPVRADAGSPEKLLSRSEIVRRAHANVFGGRKEYERFTRKFGRNVSKDLLREHFRRIKEFAVDSGRPMMLKPADKRNGLMKPQDTTIDPRTAWLHPEAPNGKSLSQQFVEATKIHPGMLELIQASKRPWATTEIILNFGRNKIPAKYKAKEKKVAQIIADLAKSGEFRADVANILHEGDEINPENRLTEGVNGLVYLVEDEGKANPRQLRNLIRLAKMAGVSIRRARIDAHENGIESAIEALKRKLSD